MQNISKQPDRVLGTDSSAENTIVWEPLDGSLPLKNMTKGSLKGAAIGGLTGLVWTFFIGRSILVALNQNAVLPEILMLLLVGLPGILFILYGLSQFRYCHEFTIDRGEVKMFRRGLIGSKRWNEPLSNYKGVLKKHEYHREAGKHRTARMVFTLKLAHDDKAKEVRLFETRTRLMSVPEKWENAWRHYARLLGVPLLEETEEGIAASQPDHIDAPVQEKIREGLLPVDHINPADAGLGPMVKVTPDGDAWVFTFQQAWTLWKAFSGLIVMTIVLFVVYRIGLIEFELMRYSILLIPLLFIFVGFSFQRKLRRPEQLAVDGQALWYRHWRGENWSTKKLSISSIREISVKSDPTHHRTKPGLVIKGGNEEIRFGWWLSRKSKIGVKDLLLSLISKGQ